MDTNWPVLAIVAGSLLGLTHLAAAPGPTPTCTAALPPFVAPLEEDDPEPNFFEQLERDRVNAALEAHRFDPVQAEGFKKLLNDLHAPKYRWYTFGLDAAVSSYFGSPREGLAPITSVIHKSLNPRFWGKSLAAGQPDLAELFLFSDQVPAWTQRELGIPALGTPAAVVIMPPVTVMANQLLTFCRNEAAAEFLVRAVAGGKPLKVYVPIKASANAGAGHYVLAVALLEPQPRHPNSAVLAGQGVRLQLDYYDSLLSGRTGLFSRTEEARFAQGLTQELQALLGPHVALAYQPRANEYHQVRSQMPGTTHCGRYVTLYIFADILGIPYSGWYQERFNRVLPDFMRVFETEPQG